MNEELALNILKWLQFNDYEIIDIYEDSFRAIRKNEYMLSELNVALNYNNERMHEANCFRCVDYVIHVLKRYE